MTKDGQMATIQVAIRIRPLTERDRTQPRFANSSSNDVLKAHEQKVQVVSQNKYFTYDHVFGPETQQSDIFYKLGEKPIEKFIEGYNVTMLAYGQTSSGKTYTMGTAQNIKSNNSDQDGIVPRAMALLFDKLKSIDKERDNYRYSVKVSFIEIYNEELVDLLDSAPANEKLPVTIREDTKGQIYWTGVKEMIVNNTEDVLNFLQQGTENRATGSTDMNEKSSRSHAIFSVALKQERKVSSQTRSSTPVKSQKQKQPIKQSSESDGDWIMNYSKFHFVDLAGSERLKRTAAEGDRRKEGININAGLLALGNVISALGDPSKKSTHVPYRDSKLTRLLQDSLGGSALTLMIACVSPAESNLSETLNTLQYANRARNIKNKVQKNELEEWMTNDNPDYLRSIIAKFKRQPIEPDESEESDSSFQQLVEPVIEEYEKSIVGLESQLQIIRDALNHSDVGFEEQRARLEQYEAIIENQEKTIMELNRRNLKLFERRRKDETYISELEKKMMSAVEETVNDRETLSELRAKILKLKEVDENTEQYIQDLEFKLSKSESDKVELKEKLNQMMVTHREAVAQKREEWLLEDQNHQKQIKELQEKLDVSEKTRQQLQHQVEHLLLENAAKSEHEQALANQTDLNYQKENKIRSLETQLANFQHDHQEVLKELDDILSRYKEVLINPDSALQHLYNYDEQIKDLKKKVKEVEDELKITLEREIQYKQLSEEYMITLELERAEKNHEFGTTSQENILYKLETLQMEFQEMKAALEVEQIQIPTEEDREIESTDMTYLKSRYEGQLMNYKHELKHLTNIMKDIKKIKAHEAKYVSSSTQPIVHSEHRVLIKNIVSLDKQLTELYEKIKLDAKRLSADVLELIYLNSDIESELKAPRLPNQPEESTDEDLMYQYENNCRAIQTRIFIAKQDLQMHQTMVFALDHKIRTSDIALSMFRKRIQNESVTDREIEELLKKMNEMKLQFDNSKKIERSIVTDI